MKKRGRPKRPGIGEWLNDDVLIARVATIIDQRDIHNEETLTNVRSQLDEVAREFLGHGPLTDVEDARLATLARRAKPSLISRTLHSWRFDLSDRTVRYFQKHILEARWA